MILSPLNRNWRSSFFWIILLGVVLAGCSAPALSETDDPNYISGQQALQDQHHSAALVHFLKVTEAHPEAPEAHFEAGHIYLKNLHDPIAAIYHFRKYLESKPTSAQAPMVLQLIETAKKDFARQLPGSYTEDTTLQQLLAQLRAENATLKTQLSTLQQSSITHILTPTPSLSLRQNYTVQASDTLSRISQKIYGTPNRWQDIYSANQPELKSPNSLKVGQILRIPE